MLNNEEKTTTYDCYEEIANAIILQAVKDYRMYNRLLRLTDEQLKKRRKERKVIEARKNEIALFFNSKWFTMLTKVDGFDLLNKLEKE